MRDATRRVERAILAFLGQRDRNGAIPRYVRWRMRRTVSRSVARTTRDISTLDANVQEATKSLLEFAGVLRSMEHVR